MRSSSRTRIAVILGICLAIVAVLALRLRGERARGRTRSEFGSEVETQLPEVADSGTPNDPGGRGAELNGGLGFVRSVILTTESERPRVFGRVEDSIGNRVPFARVELQASSETTLNPISLVATAPSSSLLTEPDGEFEFGEVASGATYLVSAGKEGWTTDRVLIATAPTSASEIVFRLRPSWTLTGTVVDTDGAPIVDASVVAWESHSSDPFREVRPSLVGAISARCRFARADADGRFIFGDLVADCAYRLLAGCRFHVMRQGLVEARPGQEPAVLTLQPLYVLLARAETETGSSLRLDPRTSTARQSTVRFQLPNSLDLLWEQEWRMSVPGVGVPSKLRSVGKGEEELVLWATGSPDDLDRNPVKATLSFPGYASKNVTLRFEPLAVHSMEPVPIRLKQKSHSFGDVNLTFHRQDGESAGLVRSPRDSMVLMFQPASASAQMVRLDCADVGYQRTTLRSLPSGSYNVRIRSTHPGVLVSPTSIQVGPDNPADLTIMVPALTRLELVLDCSPVELGPGALGAVARLHDTSQGGARPRYELRFEDDISAELAVVPGAYRVTLRFEDGANRGLKAEDAEFEVGLEPKRARIRVGPR